MKTVFLCCRSNEVEQSKEFVKTLQDRLGAEINVLQEIEQSDVWKEKVEEKIRKSDYVIFLLSEQSSESSSMVWEWECSQRFRVPSLGICVSSDPTEKESKGLVQQRMFWWDLQFFGSSEACADFLSSSEEQVSRILVEQYKLMVNSAEKVTDQRLRVNNLMFTVATSILSISVVLGKALEFSQGGLVAMMLLTFLAFLTTFVWQKMLFSYGKLNEGKFQIIDQIEARLNTDLFDREWRTLTFKGYESNTKTEISIVKRIRTFLLAVIFIEAAWLCSKLPMSDYNQTFQKLIGSI